MKSENRSIFYFFSFIVLVIAAILIFVNKLLPVVGVNASGPLFTILDTIQNIFVLLVIGFFAYYFVSGKKKAWKIVYWISLALFIVGIVLGIVPLF